MTARAHALSERCVRCCRWPAMYQVDRMEDSLDRVDERGYHCGYVTVGRCCKRCRETLTNEICDVHGGASSYPVGPLHKLRVWVIRRLLQIQSEEPNEPDEPRLYL